MDVRTVTTSATIYERTLRRIQWHLARRVRFPFEIRLWGDRAYRFREAEPAVEIRVRDREGRSGRLRATRCYSQAVFGRDDEALESAQRRKLYFAIVFPINRSSS
jgi:hypothetical protein